MDSEAGLVQDAEQMKKLIAAQGGPVRSTSMNITCPDCGHRESQHSEGGCQHHEPGTRLSRPLSCACRRTNLELRVRSFDGSKRNA